MEDINVIIRSICQDLYENLRYNNSIFANYKSLKYLKKLRKINITTDYKYAENIRDEIGILYKNYIVFCRKKEYENHCQNYNRKTASKKQNKPNTRGNYKINNNNFQDIIYSCRTVFYVSTFTFLRIFRQIFVIHVIIKQICCKVSKRNSHKCKYPI